MTVSALSAAATAIGCGCSLGMQQLIERDDVVTFSPELGPVVADRLSVLVTSKAKSNEPTGGH
jgi:hypothetical protein